MEAKEVTLESVNAKKNFEKFLKFKGANVILNLDEKEERFKAVIAINRDEFILISIIPVAGIEAMRVYCTKDSIVVLNRKDKTYYCETYEKIMSGYGVKINYNDLVAICANEFFIYRKEKKDIYDVKYEYVDNERINAKYTNSTHTENKMQQSILYNITKGTIEEINIDDDRENLRMTVNYSNFIKIEDDVFPERIYVIIVRGTDTLILKINIEKIELEEEINQYIDIPEHYIRTEL